MAFCSYFPDKRQKVDRDVTVRNVALVRGHRVRAGIVRDVFRQGNRQVPGSQVLRGPPVLDTRVGRCTGRGHVRLPVADRHRHVHDAVHAKPRTAAGQDVQPLHRHHVDHRPRLRSQRTRRESLVSAREI